MTRFSQIYQYERRHFMMNSNVIKLSFLFILLLASKYSKSANMQTQVDSSNVKMDIFLLIGQSNMQGVAPIESLDTLALKNVYLFNDKMQWEPARNLPDNGMNRYSTVTRRPVVLFGPAYTFGRGIQKYSNKTIGIVSNARGATRIEWWQKGYDGPNDFDLYEEAISRAKAALATNPNAKLKGILWHQGEADNAPSRSPLYMERLKTLVEDLRKDLGKPNLPFIAGEVGKWNGRGTNVNPVIRDIKKHITNSEWVSSDGLTSINVEKNDAHFDNLSQRVFGGRYADKVAGLCYGIALKGATIFTERNYVGRSVLLVPGKYSAENLESMGIKIQEVSSIQLDADCELMLYSSSGKEIILKSDPSFQRFIPDFVEIRKK